MTVAPAAPTCGWCREKPVGQSAKYCSRRCRQSAFRLRRRGAAPGDGGTASLTPGRFAYADPPYPGLSSKYYRNEPTFGGEVDHRELIASLTAAGYTGWALSTSSKALREVLPLCPPGARVGAWLHQGGTPTATHGMHAQWEPLIVVGGRKLPPGFKDWLLSYPARGGGTLVGRKPIAFCAWLFDCLGMVPGDELVDLFPGTGIVGRAWASLSAGARATPSQAPGRRQLLLSLLEQRRPPRGVDDAGGSDAA